MLNLRDLIFSQDSQASINSQASTFTAASASEPEYDDDEYVDYPDDDDVVDKRKKVSLKRRRSNFMGGFPLQRKGSRKFSKLYHSAPELDLLGQQMRNTDVGYTEV